MIYAIGIDSDRTFRHFIRQTHQRGIEVQAINLREVILSGDWRLTLPDDGMSWVSVGDQKLPLDPNGAYYCRIIDLSTVQSDMAMAMRWRSLLAALCVWLEHIPGVVINRPGGRTDNSSKPLHEYSLQSWGFNVPPSLTSSDPELLAAFTSLGKTIVKPASGIRADSRLVTPEEFFDFHPSQGPVHLQRYVAGADVRAHVVGDQVHAEIINCPQVDYRRSYQEAEYSPWELPEYLIKQIVKATAAFGLQFAGWDFKVTEDEQYWCLEANPMPGYDGYDLRADGKITESLLALLTQQNAVKQFPNGALITDEILTETQCSQVYETIQSLKAHWVTRGQEPASFFTLGTASYLDFLNLPDFAGDYYTRATQYNTLLQKHFSWLYELVKQSLETQLQAPVNYHSDFALPGFHIWETPAIFTKSTASVHFDLQYQNLNWQDKENIDFQRTISFTLPIKLPHLGGGLNVWDLTYDEYINGRDPNYLGDVEVMKRFRNKTVHPYNIGKIVVHGGHSLHQIAAIAQVYPGDERITLQGHGVFHNGQWLLYW
ncbi:ATP-grasp domain-containing protein [Aliinostoc sp. HNIBRCY26]|uniref:ATP-grasp domain-containing protein n=1 Tax=Aliinostoc sp. HNIBRCY26 TaxID=3418997 RepID=UPI003D07D55A